MASLQNILKHKVKEGELYQQLDEKRIRCYACGHCCPIPEGHAGVCQVRFNRGGKLLVPWGYVGGVQCDPIEKKPFFHAYPGALAYSFGMLGCDLHCGYCQNWVTSQALRDPAAVAPPRRATPQALARAVVRDVVELPEQPCSAFEPWLTRGDHPRPWDAARVMLRGMELSRYRHGLSGWPGQVIPIILQRPLRLQCLDCGSIRYHCCPTKFRTKRLEPPSVAIS